MTSEEASLSSLTSLSQTVAGNTPGKANASSSSSSVLEVIDKIRRHISSASSEGSVRSYASGNQAKYAKDPALAASSSSGLGRRREDSALRRMPEPVLPEDPTPAASASGSSRREDLTLNTTLGFGDTTRDVGNNMFKGTTLPAGPPTLFTPEHSQGTRPPDRAQCTLPSSLTPLTPEPQDTRPSDHPPLTRTLSCPLLTSSAADDT